MVPSNVKGWGKTPGEKAKMLHKVVGRGCFGDTLKFRFNLHSWPEKGKIFWGFASGRITELGKPANKRGGVFMEEYNAPSGKAEIHGDGELWIVLNITIQKR